MFTVFDPYLRPPNSQESERSILIESRFSRRGPTATNAPGRSTKSIGNRRLVRSRDLMAAIAGLFARNRMLSLGISDIAVGWFRPSVFRRRNIGITGG